jgi:membrane protein DedA with SNARE-associated domain
VNLADWPGGLAYLVVFGAAIAEGEVVFLAASVLVAQGYLNPGGVLVAGALGGAAGDNLWFHVLRGRLERWLRRVPRVARRHDIIAARVKRHATVMILALRFMIGLRVAICAACAYSRISAARFAILNLVGAFAWAAALLALVAWAGPTALAWLGFKGWWAIAVPPLLILLFTWWLAHEPRPGEPCPGCPGGDPPAYPSTRLR